MFKLSWKEDVRTRRVGTVKQKGKRNTPKILRTHTYSCYFVSREAAERAMAADLADLKRKKTCYDHVITEESLPRI